MIALGHIGGMPLEEFLPGVVGAGGSLLVARAWLAVHLRRREDRDR